MNYTPTCTPRAQAQAPHTKSWSQEASHPPQTAGSYPTTVENGPILELSTQPQAISQGLYPNIGNGSLDEQEPVLAPPKQSLSQDLSPNSGNHQPSLVLPTAPPLASLSRGLYPTIENGSIREAQPVLPLQPQLIHELVARGLYPPIKNGEINEPKSVLPPQPQSIFRGPRPPVGFIDQPPLQPQVIAQGLSPCDPAIKNGSIHQPVLPQPQLIHREIAQDKRISPQTFQPVASCANPCTCECGNNVAKVETSAESSLIGDQKTFERNYDSVVKIFCISQSKNFVKVWQSGSEMSSTSTGFLVNYGQNQVGIITNAHAVSDQLILEVRLRGGCRKFSAKVVTVAHELDLALIKVDDEDFLQRTQGKALKLQNSEKNKISLSDLPNLLERVVVVGYPMGGDALSVTAGVVSRIEDITYAHGSEQGISIQIDAAINPGNSGGPVFRGSTVIGVAFQGRIHCQGVGFIIPAAVVNFFLRQVGTYGKYSGFYGAGFHVSRIQNTSMKRLFGMQKNMHGILVTKVPEFIQQKGNPYLKKDDVIIKVDGMPIADNASVELKPGQRVGWQYIFGFKCQTNDFCVFEVLRNKQRMEICQQLFTNFWLVPKHLYGRKSSYFIFGGCVFVALSLPHILAVSSGGGTPFKEADTLRNGVKTGEDDECVVLSQVLASKVSNGYEQMRNHLLDSVNGQKIRNIKDVVRLVHSQQNNPDGFVVFRFKNSSMIVLDYKKACLESKSIYQRNGIIHDVHLEQLRDNCPCPQQLQRIAEKPSSQLDQLVISCDGCKTKIGVLHLVTSAHMATSGHAATTSAHLVTSAHMVTSARLLTSVHAARTSAHMATSGPLVASAHLVASTHMATSTQPPKRVVYYSAAAPAAF